MRKRRNKIYSFLDVGRAAYADGDIALTTEAPKSPRSSKEIEINEQRAKQAAERAATVAADDTRVREYWSGPARELMNKVGVRDDNAGLSIGESHPTAGQDSIEQMKAQGIVLSIPGLQRLGTYIESQNKHLGIAITVENLRRAYERLRSLGCFTEGEVTETPRPVPEEKSPDFKTVLEMDDGSREYAQILKRELQNVVMNESFYPVFQSWHDSVRDNFNFAMKRIHHEQAWNHIQRHNLNPLAKDGSAFNSARLELIRVGLLPDTCMTNFEWENRRLNRGEISPAQFVQRCRSFEIQNTLHKARQI